MSPRRVLPAQSSASANPLSLVITNLRRAREAQSQRVLLERAKLQQLDDAIDALIEGPRSRATRDFADLGIVTATKRLLRETRQPQTTVFIAMQLLARGVVTTSPNFVPTVYATLANAKGSFRAARAEVGASRNHGDQQSADVTSLRRRTNPCQPTRTLTLGSLHSCPEGRSPATTGTPIIIFGSAAMSGGHGSLFVGAGAQSGCSALLQPPISDKLGRSATNSSIN